MFRKRTNGSFTLLICISLVLGSALGCKRLSELVKKQDRDDAPPLRQNTEDTDLTDDQAIVKKANLYIKECYNKYSNRVVESYNRYAMWVKDMDVGPTGRESYVYGLYDLSGDGTDCENAVSTAKTLDPELPTLQDAADKYVTALKDVATNIKGIYKYYEQQDYKDDNFAKAKQAHPALIAAFRNFREANNTFSAEVDQLEDQVAEQELARLRGKPGNEYQALVVESGMKAKKVKNLLENKKFEEITADELTPLIDDFEKTAEALRAAIPSKNMSEGYARACDDFTKATKEMMRRIRDGKKFSDTEQRQIAMGAGWTVEGSPSKVIKAYNDMIFQRSFIRV